MACFLPKLGDLSSIRAQNRRLSKRGLRQLDHYAAKAAAGDGLGSQGGRPVSTNGTICSDPQSPQRIPHDDETVSQFSQ